MRKQRLMIGPSCLAPTGRVQRHGHALAAIALGAVLLSGCETLSTLSVSEKTTPCDDALQTMNAWVRAMIVPVPKDETAHLQTLALKTESVCAAPAAQSEGLTRADAALAAAYAMQRRFPLAAATVADAGEQNSPESLMVLANLTGQGMGVAKDPKRARALLDRAVEFGDVDFRLRVAQELLAGLSVERDVTQARALYKSAIDSGSADAMLAYATDYLGLFRPKTKPQAITQALKLVERAASEHQFGPAMAMLAGYYMSERGRDLAIASEWADRALATGSERGMRAKGLLAFTELRQAVGSRAAGDLSQHPHGVDAAGWFRQGANAGDFQSAAYLGELYALGIGVPKDRVEAERWLMVARSGGNRQGAALLRQLRDQRKRAG